MLLCPVLASRVRTLVVDLIPGVGARGPSRIRFELDSGPPVTLGTGLAEAVPLRIVCGDDQDLGDAPDFLGNAILVERDPEKGDVDLFSSISGLPPLFRCTHEGGTSFSTHVGPLLDRMGPARAFDPETLRDLAVSGRPGPGRTLFRGISPVAPGTRIRVSADGRISEVGHFRAPERPGLTGPDYQAAQCKALREATARIDVDQTFLSLTAGLDTRAILAALAEQDRFMDSVTLSGARDSIDVQWARSLASHYGFSHRVVHLDWRFQADLPSLCEEASRATNGLASFEQTPDLHLYRQLGGRYRARLSGLLGNQVGRSGTEGVSTRGARLDVLGPAAGVVEGGAGAHWMIEAAGEGPVNGAAFLIQVENVCSAQANYTLGASQCTQQSPYADRRVIAQKMAARPSRRSRSLRSIRMDDLRHRFLGDPVARSFQRQLIVETGGYVSECPINWGWRPRGRVSVHGAALGLGGFLDSALGVLGRKSSLIGKVRRAIHVDELTEFDRGQHLYHGRMPGFVRDTLLSDEVRGSGLFDMPRLESVLGDGFDEPANYPTIVFALDLALARKNFL